MMENVAIVDDKYEINNENSPPLKVMQNARKQRGYFLTNQSNEENNSNGATSPKPNTTWYELRKENCIKLSNDEGNEHA